MLSRARLASRASRGKFLGDCSFKIQEKAPTRKDGSDAMLSPI